MHFRPISDQNNLDEGYNIKYTKSITWKGLKSSVFRFFSKLKLGKMNRYW